jgi:hypothetical protein
LGGRNKFDVGSAFNLKIQKCIERANERAKTWQKIQREGEKVENENLCKK